MNIADLLAQPEGKTLEFKRDLSPLKAILRTIVAFANTAGGTLVIGREDDGTVVGIEDALDGEERLANAIADSIQPPMLPEIEISSLAGKALLIVRVPFWRGLFFLKAEGPEKGAYIRLGSTNRQAGPELLAELQRAVTGRSNDQAACAELSPADLDMDQLGRAFAAAGRKALDEAKLQTLGILVPHAGRLVPSQGGIILFGHDPVRHNLFPDARVSCARFLGIDKTEFLDRLDLEGSVLDAIDEVFKFIRRNTRMAARISSVRRQDIPEYPEVAIREILVNAVAHADYALTGMRIMVAIYADRLEIQNPGMMPFGMTMEELKAGVSKARNRVIVRVLRELGLIEEWGSGYKRVLEACQGNGYPLPQWQELGAAMRVTIYPYSQERASSKTDVPENVPDVPENVPNVPDVIINERQRWFLEQLARSSETRAEDIARQWQVAEKTAKRDISGLKRLGLIKFEGPARAGRYRLQG